MMRENAPLWSTQRSWHMGRLFMAVVAWLDSAIEGGDGNREFFVYARRAA